MAGRKRFTGRGKRPAKRSWQWIGFRNITPVALITAGVTRELFPDGMQGAVGIMDTTVKRIVGNILVQPQGAATASSVFGWQIRRVVNDASSGHDFEDPLNTDIDAQALDMLHHYQGAPEWGGPFDATALDFAWNIKVDIKISRRMEKRHAIVLEFGVETAVRLQVTTALRVGILT